MAMVSVTFQCNSPDEAQKLIAMAMGVASTVQTAFAPPAAAPVQTFQPAPVAMAPPFTQPAPTPATGVPGGHTTQTVAALMQQYAATFKAAGVKAAFARFGLAPSLATLDANGLNTMGQFFAQMQPA